MREAGAGRSREEGRRRGRRGRGGGGARGFRRLGGPASGAGGALSRRWRRRHLGEGGIRKCGPRRRRRRSPERRPEAPGPPAPERSGAEDAAAAAAGAAAAGAGAAAGGPGGGAGGRGRPGGGPGAGALPEAGAEAARVHLPPRPRALPHCQRLPGRAELRVPAGWGRRGRGGGRARTAPPRTGVGAWGSRSHPLQHHGENPPRVRLSGGPWSPRTAFGSRKPWEAESPLGARAPSLQLTLVSAA